MAKGEKEEGFWAVTVRECRPILTHAAIVLVLEGCLVLMGLMARGLEHLFPERSELIEWFHTVDIWFAFALLVMFGVYTILQVAIGMFRGIQASWRQK